MKLRHSFLAALIAVTVVSFISKGASSAQPAPVYSVVYSLADLPVYRIGNEFDPSLLIAHIKQSVAPESRRFGNGDASVFTNNLSIVVSQTKADHERLQDFLESLREEAAD